MDSPPPPPPLAQLVPKSAIQQQQHDTSRRSQMQQPDHKMSGQFQMESTVESPDNTSEQSKVGPETTYTAVLEAKIASLQSELDLLKSAKPQHNSNVYNLIFENETLKTDLVKARRHINVLLGHVNDKDQEITKLRNLLGMEEEEVVDRKGKKVAEIDKKRTVKQLICITRKGTDEVLNIMPLSESSDDDSDSDEELESDEEEDVAQIKTVLKMARLEGIGSSSKMGSRSAEVGDIVQSMSGMDCAPSNGEVEKLNMLDGSNPSTKESLKSETDFIPKYLNHGEITSCDKKLYSSNYQEGSTSKLPGSSESGSSSCQTDLPPDLTQSKSTTDAPLILKLNDNEEKLTHRKRKWDVYWGSEEDMLCSLTSDPAMLLEAVCALYRMERKMRYCRPNGMHYKGISESDYKSLMQIAAVLMEGDMWGPNKKTTEDLAKYTSDTGLNFCAMLVGTYSTQLFHIYKRGLDPHFR